MRFLIAFILLLPVFCISQTDTLQHYHSPFSQIEKSIGVIPSVQNLGEFSLGLDVAMGRFANGEGGGNAWIYSGGIEYFPKPELFAVKTSVWLTGYAFIFGGNIKGSAIYYYKDGKKVLTFRPEIGIGLYYFQISYGLNLQTNNDIEEIPEQTLTFSFYIPVIKSKK
jgi:hypothetical protein